MAKFTVGKYYCLNEDSFSEGFSNFDYMFLGKTLAPSVTLTDITKGGKFGLFQFFNGKVEYVSFPLAIMEEAILQDESDDEIAEMFFEAIKNGQPQIDIDDDGDEDEEDDGDGYLYESQAPKPIKYKDEDGAILEGIPENLYFVHEGKMTGNAVKGFSVFATSEDSAAKLATLFCGYTPESGVSVYWGKQDVKHFSKQELTGS